MAKFYGVRIGHSPGVYTSWDACRREVDGYKGAEYKSFKSRTEAEAYLGNEYASESAGETADDSSGKSPVMKAFIDGSYDNSRKIYSYGSVITWNGQKIKLYGADSDSRFVDFRNVAGEIIAATRTLQFAVENQQSAIDIYFDYMGIEKWATREWKRNNELTRGYSDYVESIEDQIKIRFVKVKAHSGHAENDEVDALAKFALNSKKKHNMVVEPL